jgi:NitT/TauT family transport system substrate-binding protein
MQFGRPRRSRLLVSALALTLLGATACGGDDDKDQSATGGLEKTTVTVRYLPVADVASLYIGIQKGYFKAEGLEVKPQLVQNGQQAIQSLGAGKLDVVFANYVSLFAAESKGAKLAIVSDGYQTKPNTFLVMVRPDSPIKKITDLRGKTIGVSTLKNIAQLTADSSLNASGVDPNSVKYKQVDNPEMAAALKSGSIDAAFMLEPFISQGQQQDGLVTVFDAAQGATADLAVGGYATTEQFRQKNPKTYAAFGRAMAKAQADAAKRENVEKVLSAYTKIDAKTASVITFGAYPTTVNKTRLQRVVDLMVQFHQLPNAQAVNLDRMLGAS